MCQASIFDRTGAKERCANCSPEARPVESNRLIYFKLMVSIRVPESLRKTRRVPVKKAQQGGNRILRRVQQQLTGFGASSKIDMLNQRLGEVSE